MCKPASFVVTKDKVLWSDSSDNHEDIIEQYGLVESVNNKICFVRVEIAPKNNDLSTELATWDYVVDQDLLPEWYTKEDTEHRARITLVEWYKTKVLINDRAIIRDKKQIYAYGSSSVKAFDSSSVKAYGSSSVETCDSSSVKACDSSSVKAFGSSSVKAFDSSSVKAYGSSSVKACDSSSVKACDSSSVETFGSSSVKAFDSSSVRAYGSSSVKACEDHATVRLYDNSTLDTVITSNFPVCIDCRGDKAICITKEKGNNQ